MAATNLPSNSSRGETQMDVQECLLQHMPVMHNPPQHASCGSATKEWHPLTLQLLATAAAVRSYMREKPQHAKYNAPAKDTKNRNATGKAEKQEHNQRGPNKAQTHQEEKPAHARQKGPRQSHEPPQPSGANKTPRPQTAKKRRARQATRQEGPTQHRAKAQQSRQPDEHRKRHHPAGPTKRQGRKKT